MVGAGMFFAKCLNLTGLNAAYYDLIVNAAVREIAESKKADDYIFICSSHIQSIIKT
jgi:hypothetical protein